MHRFDGVMKKKPMYHKIDFYEIIAFWSKIRYYLSGKRLVVTSLLTYVSLRLFTPIRITLR